METLKITKKDIKDGKYIAGAVEFNGHIEIEGHLGYVLFDSLKAAGYILAKAGTGIKAGEGIEAGTEISVKLRIFAGLIMWRKPKPEETEIKCKRLTSGEVAYGNLIESSKDTK